MHQYIHPSRRGRACREQIFDGRIRGVDVRARLPQRPRKRAHGVRFGPADERGATGQIEVAEDGARRLAKDFVADLSS